MKMAEAFIEARIDDSKVKGDMRKVEGDVKASGDRMGKSLTDSGDKAFKAFTQAFGAVAFGAGIKGAIDSASRLQQAVGATETVFGSASKSIDSFARHSADAVGLSEAAFREVTGAIGALLTNMGYTETAAADMSVKLTQMGADLAAAFGGKPEDAVHALGRALVGEFDPLEQFNISLTQAKVNTKAMELGLYSGTGALDSHAKAQATLALITEQAATTQGTFTREADTAAGAQVRAKAAAEDSAASLGKNFLPVYQKITELVGLLADGFGALPGPVQLGVVALVGFVALSGPIKSMVSIFKDVGTAIGKIPEGAKSAGIALGALATVVMVGLTLRSQEVQKSNAAMLDSFNELSKVSGPQLFDQFVASLGRAMLAGHGTDEALKLLAQTNLAGAEKVLVYASALGDANKLSEGQLDVLNRLREAVGTEEAAVAEAARTQATYGAATEGATKATTAAGDASVAAASDMAQWSDAANTAKDDANKLQRAVDEMDTAYQRLMGHLGDQSAWASVSSASAELQAKMLLGAAGTSEQERALLSAKEAAARYVQGLANVPPEVKSRLYAEIDMASVGNIYSVLADLSRTRFVNIVAIGGMAVDSAVRNAQEGRGVVSAEGRFVAGGTNMTSGLGEIPGRRGDEVVLPLGNPSRLAALLGDRRVGPRVAAAMGGGAGFAGASVATAAGASAAGGDIITVIIEGEPLTGRIVARERRLVAAMVAGRRA